MIQTSPCFIDSQQHSVKCFSNYILVKTQLQRGMQMFNNYLNYIIFQVGTLQDTSLSLEDDPKETL